MSRYELEKENTCNWIIEISKDNRYNEDTIVMYAGKTSKLLQLVLVLVNLVK